MDPFNLADVQLSSQISYRSLFVAWGASEDFWGDHTVFKRTEGESALIDRH